MSASGGAPREPSLHLYRLYHSYVVILRYLPHPLRPAPRYSRSLSDRLLQTLPCRTASSTAACITFVRPIAKLNSSADQQVRQTRVLSPDNSPDNLSDAQCPPAPDFRICASIFRRPSGGSIGEAISTRPDALPSRMACRYLGEPDSELTGFSRQTEPAQCTGSKQLSRRPIGKIRPAHPTCALKRPSERCPRRTASSTTSCDADIQTPRPGRRAFTSAYNNAVRSANKANKRRFRQLTLDVSQGTCAPLCGRLSCAVAALHQRRQRVWNMRQHGQTVPPAPLLHRPRLPSSSGSGSARSSSVRIPACSRAFMNHLFRFLAGQVDVR